MLWVYTMQNSPVQAFHFRQILLLCQRPRASEGRSKCHGLFFLRQMKKDQNMSKNVKGYEKYQKMFLSVSGISWAQSFGPAFPEVMSVTSASATPITPPICNRNPQLFHQSISQGEFFSAELSRPSEFLCRSAACGQLSQRQPYCFAVALSLQTPVLATLPCWGWNVCQIHVGCNCLMRMFHHVSVHSINSQRLGSGLTASRVICANVHCGRLGAALLFILSLHQHEVERRLCTCWHSCQKLRLPESCMPQDELLRNKHAGVWWLWKVSTSGAGLPKFLHEGFIEGLWHVNPCGRNLTVWMLIYALLCSIYLVRKQVIAEVAEIDAMLDDFAAMLWSWGIVKVGKVDSWHWAHNIFHDCGYDTWRIHTKRSNRGHRSWLVLYCSGPWIAVGPATVSSTVASMIQGANLMHLSPVQKAVQASMNCLPFLKLCTQGSSTVHLSQNQSRRLKFQLKSPHCKVNGKTSCNESTLRS